MEATAVQGKDQEICHQVGPHLIPGPPTGNPSKSFTFSEPLFPRWLKQIILLRKLPGGQTTKGSSATPGCSVQFISFHLHSSERALSRFSSTRTVLFCYSILSPYNGALRSARTRTWGFESPSSYSLDSFISRSWDSVSPLSLHLPRHHCIWATFNVVPQTWLPNCCPHSQAIPHATNRDKNLIESSSTHLRGFLLPLGQNSILKQGSSLPVPAPYGTFPTLPLYSHPSRLQQAPSCLVNCYSSFRALLKCHHLGDGFPDLHPFL